MYSDHTVHKHHVATFDTVLPAVDSQLLLNKFAHSQFSDVYSQCWSVAAFAGCIVEQYQYVVLNCSCTLGAVQEALANSGAHMNSSVFGTGVCIGTTTWNLC